MELDARDRRTILWSLADRIVKCEDNGHNATVKECADHWFAERDAAIRAHDRMESIMNGGR